MLCQYFKLRPRLNSNILVAQKFSYLITSMFYNAKTLTNQNFTIKNNSVSQFKKFSTTANVDNANTTSTDNSESKNVIGQFYHNLKYKGRHVSQKFLRLFIANIFYTHVVLFIILL